MKVSKLILSSGLMLLVSAVAVSGHDHGRRQQPGQDVPRPPASAPAPQAANEDSVPAYLLAAICGMSAKEGDAAFERRVQLARLLSDRAQIDADNEPPLFTALGDFTYPITTDEAIAQRYFDQGLRLMHAFNHPEALRAFRFAQQIDPACAMCSWGEAYVLGPNINAPMDPAAVAPAAAAILRAKERAATASERERTLIAALDKRYSPDPQADRSALNRAYADAMADASARFPGDVEIATLYADALMNLLPWDYWEADGRTLKPQVANLVSTLEGALAKDPRHPYALHLYIHAVEASAAPERAESYAEWLGPLMPGAGHMVHMPSHIYFRLGRFQDSIAANRDAVAADEEYLAEVSPYGAYPYSYYPHNVHFLLESARMVGDGPTALAAADKLPRIMSDEVSAEIPWVQVIKTAPYFAHAQFSPAETTLSMPDPGDRFPYVRAMWHYARGVAYAARGNAQAARSEAMTITRIGDRSDFTQMTSAGVPAPDIVRLASRVVDGRVAQAEGDYDAAAAAFRDAVAIQDGLPYTEPPYWYYPVRQSLGAVLLQAGKPAEAEGMFREALREHPNGAWALFGLREAQRAQGNAAAVAETQRQLDAVWEGDRREITLSML
jgi:tetratricopeptide (TPR) repeat protein